MSTPFSPGGPPVGGFASQSVSGGIGGAGVPHGNALAFTGVGPGTAVLGVAGLLSLLAGFGALLMGKRLHPVSTSGSQWSDLASRATAVRPDRNPH